jgi:hypothetical protein
MSFRFFTLPHHTYNLRCIKTDVVAVAESPDELTSLKVHEMFKRDFRLTYDTGLCSVKHKQTRTVLFSDQTAVFLCCTWSGPGPNSPTIWWTLKLYSWRMQSPYVTLQHTSRAHKFVINNLKLIISLLFCVKSAVLASANVFFIAALAIRYCVPTDVAARPAVFRPTKQKRVT